MYKLIVIALSVLMGLIVYNYIHVLYMNAMTAKREYLKSIGFIMNVQRIGYKGKTELRFVKGNVIITERQIIETTLSELKEQYH